MRPLPWSRIGAVLGGLAVAFGAFAAHGLDDYFAKKYHDLPPKTVAGFAVPASWKYLQDFRTGAEYQMYHALALVGVGLAAARTRRRRTLDLAGWCFLLGIVLFSGSLYVLTLTGETRWAIATPFGGVFFLVGWTALAFSIVDQRGDARSEG
ncbi:MAG TPA: DUF423 domain-containing protein [Planctomycetaceae bacterium]|jgi:uncharacterized membrane protein YgdD (TMEM256/DUF423 family)|nr:DUF423 domain-containing protein [Planctomycetaceae bacterium]